jgi:hypothetical protein
MVVSERRPTVELRPNVSVAVSVDAGRLDELLWGLLR